ncbi:membrane-bound PQQ-dependent dehydrogenase, glucose/quinate/shikimate family [Aureimonas flava]|uniref:Membrane-bound PQQ-dependent dehydrogenase, glucose/quinate/shikimate family n=1 Tax=Aureimonas flava TaxID=2320271 RepID=A0A3A1WJR4_9HYPH|nr:membrane-bound PQQ-dependent dehydrogenase, glucose/quinate/shikimate family [Aureimonas flava]RIY00119.1 membrane-bound PQQ-dependent dehydrogenase, glucose/quinate/shikimate family [Aureimonas flava]
MPTRSSRTFLRVMTWVVGLCGVALLLGGGWLVAVGGSFYYVVAALLFLTTAVLLHRGRPEALSVFAVLVVGTLIWALYEVGFDWWPLAARGDVVFVIGALLLLPWVARPLARRTVADALDGRGAALSPVAGHRAFLAASLLAAVAVAATSWFTDLHRIRGELPGTRLGVGDGGVAEGDWLAYGRSQMGQRYSPLTDVTPDNVSSLQVAWHFETGDEPQPGDPEETTFQVTPLKIGERLYLCTPHQNVIALDATTGAQVWRYDPVIQGELALQHLTCRGLSYQSAEAAAAAAPQAAAPAEPASPSQPAASTAPQGTASELAAGGGLTAPQEDAATPGASDGAPVDETGGSADPGLPVAAANARTATCDDKLFMPTADGRIVILDPETGAVCANAGGGDGQIDLWDRMPNVNPGSYYSTSPVIVAGNSVIVGGTVLDNVSTAEASGVIRAFDITTGNLLWNWDSGKPNDTQPIGAGETYTPNSPNSWSIMSADEALGLVYVPLGNQPPDQWGANRSPEVEAYSSSIVALDIRTGQPRWHFQTVHHDLWDYDVPAQPSLIDLPIGDEIVPALVQPTKQGEIFVLDRRTGEPVMPVVERRAPGGAVLPDRAAPTQPKSAISFDPPPLRERDMWGATMFDQLACRIAFHGLAYGGRFTPPSLDGSLIYPGNFGVFNWGSVAVDPARGVMFATPTYLAFTSRLVPRPDSRTLVVNDSQPQGALPALNENFGAPYAIELGPFTSALGLPCQQPPWGYVAGVDLTTGETAWMHKNGTTRDASPIPLPFRMGVPNLGGPMMTAGGVAFLSGTIDDYVRGYDVTTGEELWKARLPAGGQATPMTYRGADGRQYVLVVAGGHGSLGTKRGDSVIAYALP